jgi:hypothetical protein
MPSLPKKIAVSLILLSFVAIALFGFAAMTKEPDGKMFGNCPFSAMGVSLCPQDVAAMIFHHASAYQSFINIPINSGATAFVSLLLAAFVILLASLNSSPLGLLFPPGIPYDSPPTASYKRKATHWLALHENSPAVFRMPT